MDEGVVELLAFLILHILYGVEVLLTECEQLGALLVDVVLEGRVQVLLLVRQVHILAVGDAEGPAKSTWTMLWSLRCR